MKKAKTVFVITSHVVRGRVGARSSVFALERLGFPVWFLPSVTLSWHPGHGASASMTATDEQFAAIAQDIASHPSADTLSAIITGYLGNAQQAVALETLITTLKQKSPDLIYCCDPVIGDESGLYVQEETARAIKDRLLPLADIITPNRFEFDWLSSKAHTNNEGLVETAKQMPHKIIAITSAFAMMKMSKGVLLADKTQDQAYLAEHRRFDDVPNGTGDLFTGLFVANLLRDWPTQKALQTATAAVFDIVAQSVKQESDELVLIEEQSRIEHPMAMVAMRRLGGKIVKQKGLTSKPTSLI